MYNTVFSILAIIPTSLDNPVYPVRPVYSFLQFLQPRKPHLGSHIPITISLYILRLSKLLTL